MAMVKIKDVRNSNVTVENYCYYECVHHLVNLSILVTKIYFTCGNKYRKSIKLL